jgi:uncharacterized SAM-binding protein YcdF (DUF218 family)
MLFSPGAWFAASCALGAALLWWRPRIGRWLVVAGAAGFLLVAVLPLDQWALAPLENRFPAQQAAEPPVAGIIVLGGSLDAALTADRGMPSLGGAAERLTRFASLALRYPEARLVFTGGPSSNRPNGPPEADGVRVLLQSLGVPAGRVTFEAASRTTWENAVLALALVKPKPGETWRLITSAAHMPRAIGAFRKAGWQVIADPVGYKSYRDPADRGTSMLGERLALLETAAHEWLGLVAYAVSGRSTSLFPGP